MISSLNNSVLMSIRPKYANLIFSGLKTHELRRKIPNVSSGDVIVVYSSSPEKRMKGIVRVKKVITLSKSNLWDLVAKSSGVSKAEFYEYFKGLSEANAIELEVEKELENGADLEAMRCRVNGFRPPQNYSYIRTDEFLRACID